jgi:hypothetical protein
MAPAARTTSAPAVARCRFVVATPFDSHRASPLEQQLCRVGAGDDGQVGTSPGRSQIGHGGTDAKPAPRGGLVVAGALLGRAVEVVVARMSRLLRRRDEGVAERMGFGLVRDGQGAALAVEGVGPARLVLGLAEVGQDVVMGPADIAQLAPVVEVLLLTADIDQTVDRAGAAQNLAARLVDPAVVEAGLRRRLEHPVDLGVNEQLSVAERDMDPGIAVLAARFQQQDLVLAVGAQPIGQDAAGRTRADDDVVECAELTHAAPRGPVGRPRRLWPGRPSGRGSRCRTG